MTLTDPESSNLPKEPNRLDQEVIFRKSEVTSNKNDVIEMENFENIEKKEAEKQKMLNVSAMPDFTHINNMFNSYSTKKTFATGLLDLALIANNFSQMKQLILSKQNSPWQVLDIVIMISISASLFLQFICGIIIIFSSKHEEFTNDAKRPELVKKNNFITLLIVVICFVNIFVNVFINI